MIFFYCVGPWNSFFLKPFYGRSPLKLGTILETPIFESLKPKISHHCDRSLRKRSKPLLTIPLHTLLNTVTCSSNTSFPSVIHPNLLIPLCCSINSWHITPIINPSWKPFRDFLSCNINSRLEVRFICTLPLFTV